MFFAIIHDKQKIHLLGKERIAQKNVKLKESNKLVQNS